MANVSKLKLNGISYDIKDNDAREQLALIQNQINQLIAPSGEAPNPAEVQNARIGIDGTVYNTLGNAIRTQINNLTNLIINNGGGLSTDAKMALLTCFQKVAWIDGQGQIYYNALYHSLFPTAISISVIFNSASHIFYETNTLNDLRPYLIVSATLPDNTTEIITNYSLQGSMTVGTNIITVHYQGLTDTFSVTVAADPSYITATFTQPQTTIYTDDSLDSLKSYLVVTYYTTPGATGTVLVDSTYTLSGTLIDGTSTVVVTYENYTTTFSVNAELYSFAPNYSWGAPSTSGNAFSYTPNSIRATANPMIIKLRPGLYEADISNFPSGLYYSIGTLTYDEDLYNIDFSFTQGTAKTFMDSSQSHTISYPSPTDAASGWINTKVHWRIPSTITGIYINVKKGSAGTDTFSNADVQQMNGTLVFRRVDE